MIGFKRANAMNFHPLRSNSRLTFSAHLLSKRFANGIPISALAKQNDVQPPRVTAVAE